MVSFANVATPFRAATVAVPPSVPPAGFVAIASVTSPLKLTTVVPSASCAVTCTAGVIAAPAAVVLGGTVKLSCVTVTATRKSAAVSALPPNATQAPARPVGPPARPCQWYDPLSFSPATVAVAVAPFATDAPEPLGTPLNAVPSGSTSTSRRNWSPAFGSVTVALNTTQRPLAVPPTAMDATPSPWNCARAVRGPGGFGTAVTKSVAVSALPPNGAQALARPVWSSARACQ